MSAHASVLLLETVGLLLVNNLTQMHCGACGWLDVCISMCGLALVVLCAERLGMSAAAHMLAVGALLLVAADFAVRASLGTGLSSDLITFGLDTIATVPSSHQIVFAQLAHLSLGLPAATAILFVALHVVAVALLRRVARRHTVKAPSVACILWLAFQRARGSSAPRVWEHVVEKDCTRWAAA